MNLSSLQPLALSVSRLVRNVPIVISLEMSSFLVVGCTGCLFPIVLSLRRSISTTDNELLFGLESPADAEHVAIGMAKVHLADVPRHVGGRKSDL